jgi:hypothetical protein
MLPIWRLYDRAYDSVDSIKAVNKDDKEIILEKLIDFEGVKGFRAKRSSKIIRLPLEMTADLAYFLGIVIGDGYVKMVKRNKGGYYWDIVITGEKNYIELLAKITNKLFGHRPTVKKDKRREKSYILTISSMIVFRYLTRVFGFHPGKKCGNIPRIRFVCDGSFHFRNYLSGLIDSDGYVSSSYAALIQKDRKFLNYIRAKSKKLLNFEFSTVRVNRRIEMR